MWIKDLFVERKRLVSKDNFLTALANIRNYGRT